jgi:hypothetical protein
MNEIRARWETPPDCVSKLWDNETRLFVSKTPEWIRVNSFLPLRRSWTIVNFGHGENINAKGERSRSSTVAFAAQHFMGFFSVEMRRRNREEREGLARIGMQPKIYKESPR